MLMRSVTMKWCRTLRWFASPDLQRSMQRYDLLAVHWVVDMQIVDHHWYLVKKHLMGLNYPVVD
jgi:hypothetical protein